ncbi:Poly-beta-1,6-N-acetyl-D-glucosamine N-deacetylase precursor [compost metagenome]
MKHLKKPYIVALIITILLGGMYFTAVANPTNALSRKACSSWSIVKDQSYLLSHSAKVGQAIKLPDDFSIPDGTADHVPVLMYHYITPKDLNKEPGNNSIINLESFEESIKYLYDQGYYTATLEELEKYIHGEISLPLKTVVITFDDGYQNNYIYAYPILKKYGFHASIFLIGSKIEKQTAAFDPAKKSYLSFDEIKASSDVFEFNSHTYDLHYKGFEKCGIKYSSGLDTKLIEQDIAEIKSLGIDTPYFAYPFGEKSRPMMYLLQKNGYRMAFTVRQGFVRPGDPPMNLQRLTVTSSTQMSELLKAEHSKP